MSIPLDRLYDFVESISREIPLERDVIIYRFWPHGSKKIQDLLPLHDDQNRWLKRLSSPHLYCYDQEPLDFDAYENIDRPGPAFDDGGLLKKHGVSMPRTNIRLCPENIYDQCMLLHSEQRSSNLDKYAANGFIPVYYWSHAIIARDWFRYAEHLTQDKKSTDRRFFAYNRAWTGTREYRLKFADLLVENQLLDSCTMPLNPRDPDSGLHYDDHAFRQQRWRPKNRLENFFRPTSAPSSASADFDMTDYRSADFEIVLETLFDDDRLHLTEKILRPMALGQPFLLCATAGSLDYLRRYGFETFGQYIDESYDLVQDAEERLRAIIASMRQIAEWTDEQRHHNMQAINDIARRNQERFFSRDFSHMVIGELRHNLHQAIMQMETTNTCRRWFERRKYFATFPEINHHQLSSHPWRSRKDIADLVLIARKYRK